MARALAEIVTAGAPTCRRAPGHCYRYRTHEMQWTLHHFPLAIFSCPYPSTGVVVAKATARGGVGVTRVSLHVLVESVRRANEMWSVAEK